MKSLRQKVKQAFRERSSTSLSASPVHDAESLSEDAAQHSESKDVSNECVTADAELSDDEDLEKHDVRMLEPESLQSLTQLIHHFSGNECHC